jgi:hypothetical protein
VSGFDVAERFQKDAANHEMTVLHEDGLYRHLRFTRVVTLEDGRRSRSSAYWFDLITWPGNLTISGDMDTFTFARLDDMFEFFRGSQINPQYWAEKIRGPSRVQSYSEDRFRECVMDEVKATKSDYPGLADAVEDYFFGPFAEWNTEHEGDALAGLNRFEYLPEGTEGQPFTFTDTWEWGLQDWDFRFLWCCHAIQWGIGQYDASKAVAK